MENNNISDILDNVRNEIDDKNKEMNKVEKNYNGLFNDVLKEMKKKLKRKEIREVNNKYVSKYRAEHPEKWYKKNICKICGGKYMNCGKTSHLRTRKHKFKLLEIENKKLKGL